MVKKLAAVGANVIVHGENWNEADALAKDELKKSKGAFYIPPYGAHKSFTAIFCANSSD